MYITYIIYSYNLPENMHYNAYSLYNIMALFIFLFIYLYIYAHMTLRTKLKQNYS